MEKKYKTVLVIFAYHPLKVYIYGQILTALFNLKINGTLIISTTLLHHIQNSNSLFTLLMTLFKDYNIYQLSPNHLDKLRPTFFSLGYSNIKYDLKKYSFQNFEALPKTNDIFFSGGLTVSTIREKVLEYTNKNFHDLKKIIIDIKVPENYVSVLKSGLKAEVTSSAYEKIFKGKIETISSRIDPSTRSILSRIVVDNSNFEIIPGQLMTVKIIYDEIQQIGVPESAVTIQGDTAFVYTVTDDAAKKQNIKIGKRNFGKVSAISGLNEGDIVIVEGVSKVRDKAKVKIVTPAK